MSMIEQQIALLRDAMRERARTADDEDNYAREIAYREVAYAAESLLREIQRLRDEGGSV